MNGDPNFSGLRVLVVEDDMLITMLLEDSLVDLGCTIVGPAACVADAIKLISDQSIDVALLDLHLGSGETGYTVADALAGPGVPFAFVTGYDAGSLREGYRHCPTLQKPFGIETLANVLVALAGARAA